MPYDLHSRYFHVQNSDLSTILVNNDYLDYKHTHSPDDLKQKFPKKYLFLQVLDFFVGGDKNTLILQGKPGRFRRFLSKYIMSNKWVFRIIALALILFGLVINIVSNVIGRHLVGFASIILPFGIYMALFLYFCGVIRKKLQENLSSYQVCQKYTSFGINRLLTYQYHNIYSFHQGWLNTELKESKEIKQPTPKDLNSLTKIVLKEHRRTSEKVRSTLDKNSQGLGQQLIDEFIGIEAEDLICNDSPDKKLSRQKNTIIILFFTVPFVCFSGFFWNSDQTVAISLMLFAFFMITRAVGKALKPKASLNDNALSKILQNVLKKPVVKSFISNIQSQKRNDTEVIYVGPEPTRESLASQIKSELKSFEPDHLQEKDYDEAAGLIVNKSKAFIDQVLKNASVKLVKKIIPKCQNDFLNIYSHFDIIQKLVDDDPTLQVLDKNFKGILLAACASDLKDQNKLNVFCKIYDKLESTDQRMLNGREPKDLFSIGNKIKCLDKKNILLLMSLQDKNIDLHELKVFLDNNEACLNRKVFDLLDEKVEGNAKKLLDLYGNDERMALLYEQSNCNTTGSGKPTLTTN